jgi:recombination protein RecT
MSTAAPSSNARAQVAKRASQPPAEQTPQQMLAGKIAAMRDTGELTRALPSSIITPERFTRVALTAIRKNPDLAQCDHTSVLGALVTAAQLGLEVNTPLGQASLVPFKDKDNGYRLAAQLIIEYRGYISLGYRSEMLKRVVARTVYENDEFDREEGDNPRLYHKPVKAGPSGEAIGYYAIIENTFGGKVWHYMTREDVEKWRQKYSKSPNSPGWRNSFDQMAWKTCLRQLFRFMPISVELARAAAVDGSAVQSVPDPGDMPDVIDAEVVDPETGEVSPDLDVSDMVSEPAFPEEG